MTDLESVEHFGGRATSPAARDRQDVDPARGPLHTASGSPPAAATQLPRVGLLRDLTDRAVLDQVLRRGRVTRAELSAVTGISKPTISDAVRRMGDRGILDESGLQTGRRGRIATYYELSRTSGWVAAVELDADGISLAASGLCGGVFSELSRPLPQDPSRLVQTVRSALSRQRRAAHDRGPLRVVAISAPGQAHLDAHAIVGDLGGTAVLVDNAVHLAAHAERQIGVAQQASSFGYLHLGTGLGCAFRLGDQLIRGAHGLAGKIGLLPTGPGGDVNALQALVRLGFGRADGAGLDVERIRDVLDRAGAGDSDADTQVDALCDVLGMAVAAIIAVNDPELFVVGGPLGRHPVLFDRLRASLDRHQPPAAAVVVSAVDGPAALRGAMLQALADAREMLMRRVA